MNVDRVGVTPETRGVGRQLNLCNEKQEDQTHVALPSNRVEKSSDGEISKIETFRNKAVKGQVKDDALIAGSESSLREEEEKIRRPFQRAETPGRLSGTD